MAANQLENVLMFFFKKGSKDYPLNCDINSPFGWDVDASGNVNSDAVFKYSINEVEKAFVKVREISKEAYYDASTHNNFANIGDDADNLIDVALVETGNNSKYSVDYSAQGLDTSDPSNGKVWTDIFRILEWVYANQATANGKKWSGADTGDLLTAADCALYSNYGENTPNTSGSNPYKVDTYVKNSIQMYPSTKDGRLSYIRFSVKDSDNNGNQVNVIAYFDADDWVERSTNISYRVYRYEDLNNDTTIDSNEFDKQIVAKIFEISKTGKFKNYSTYTVEKRISDDTYTQEQFFIFTSLATELTAATMLEQVKNYLLGLGLGQSYLTYTYPKLFGLNTIQIVPIWDNVITTKDSGNVEVYPLSLAKLYATLNQFNRSITPGESGYSPVEIFYIGPGNGWVPSVNVGFILPLIAIEQDSTSGVSNPISARFPSYQPIYGQNKNDDASEFHFILLKILFYLYNSENKLSESFKSSYNIVESTSADNANRKTITFTFGGNTWTVYGRTNSFVTA